MARKKQKLNVGKLVIILTILAFLLTTLLPLFAAESVSSSRQKLSNLTKKKNSIASKLKETRKKEASANRKLNEIQGKLSRAQRKLSVNQRYLTATRQAWQKTRDRLGELKEQQSQFEGKAQDRIVSIYQQERIKLIDGLLHANSITDFLDNLYYQKRVIEYDRKLIQALVDQSENIKKYNETLEGEASKMRQITKKLEGVKRDVEVQKSAQKKIVNKLRSERKVYEQAERQLEQESIKLVYKISKLSADGKFDNPDATGKFIYPVKARITSPFGPRRHPIFGVRSMHSGIDLGAPRGANIKASEGGLVIYSGWYGGYGKVVIVDHSKGYSTLYAHMDKIKVKVGDRVRQGQVVGSEGSTGYATGPHLHFEVRTKGRPQNPTLYLEKS